MGVREAAALLRELGIDPVTVLADSLRIEFTAGQAQLRWEGFKTITPAQADALVAAWHVGLSGQL